MIFEYESNSVIIKLEGRKCFKELKDVIGSYFFLAEDLIYFKVNLKFKIRSFSDKFLGFLWQSLNG